MDYRTKYYDVTYSQVVYAHAYTYMNSLEHAVTTSDLQARPDETHHALILRLTKMVVTIAHIMCNYNYVQLQLHRHEYTPIHPVTDLKVV